MYQLTFLYNLYQLFSFFCFFFPSIFFCFFFGSLLLDSLDIDRLHTSPFGYSASDVRPLQILHPFRLALMYVISP